MDEITFDLFEKDVTIRTLHYRNKLQELKRGQAMRAFIDEARKVHLPLTFGLAVDQYACFVGIDLAGPTGQLFLEGLYNFVAGSVYRVQGEIDDMLRFWPLLTSEGDSFG